MISKIKSNKKICVILLGFFLISSIIVCYFIFNSNYMKYKNAEKLITEKNYTSAEEILKELGNYKDSKILHEECNFQISLLNIENGNYDEALAQLSKLKKSDKVEKAINQCNYEKALLYINDNNFLEAINLLVVTANNKYEDSDLKLTEAKCLYAEQLLGEQKPEKAYGLLYKISEPTDKSQELLIQAKYEIGLMYYQKGDVEKTIEYLSDLNYKDSEKIIDDIMQNDHGLKSFVARYNNMMHELDKRGEIAVDIMEDKIKTGKATLMSDAILSLNNDSQEKNVKLDISNFNFYLNNLDEYSLLFAMSELYATIAAFDPDSTYDSVENIVSHILDDGEYDENGIHYVNYSGSGLLFIVGTRME